MAWKPFKKAWSRFFRDQQLSLPDSRRWPGDTRCRARPCLEILETRISPSITYDLQENLFGALGNLGQQVQDTVGQVFDQQTGSPSLPFTSTTLQTILNLPQTFENLINQLSGPTTITGVTATATSLSDTPLAISIKHAAPVLVDIGGGNYLTAGGVAGAFNTALSNAGLSTQLTAGTSGNDLTLQTTASAQGSSVGLTEVVLTAAAAGPNYGQPGVNVTFQLTFTTEQATTIGNNPVYQTNTDNVTISLPSASTAADTSMNDLATQLNTAFANAFTVNPTVTELQNLYAEVQSGHLVLVTTDPDITGITITDEGNLHALGFTTGQVASTAATALGLTNFGTTGISGLIATPQSGFDPTDNSPLSNLTGSDHIFLTALQAISSNPSLLGSFDPGWHYDNTSEEVTFGLDFNKTFTAPVAIDLTKGISLGPLGTLQITADASATATATVNLDLQLGIFLGLPITASIANLNAGMAPGDQNAGSGIPVGSGSDTFIINDGTPHTVDLTSNAITSVQGVINAITAADGALSVKVNPNNGLTLNANNPSTTITITDGAGGDAAALGLLNLTSSNGILTGTSLYGESPADQVVILSPPPSPPPPPNLSVTVTLKEGNNDSLDAALGLLEIGITDPTPLQVQAEFDVSLKANTTFHTLGQDVAMPATLYTLFQAPPAVTFTAQGQLALSANLGSMDVLPTGTGLATLDVSLSNPNSLSSITFTPDTTGLTDALQQLQQLTPAQLLGLAQNLLSSLESSNSLPFLNQKLQLLGNKSIEDELGLANKLLGVFNTALSSLNTSAVQSAYNVVQSALTDLDLPANLSDAQTALVDGLQQAIAEIQGILNGPITTLPSRLISATSELNDAYKAFYTNFVPSVLPATDMLLENLGSAVSSLAKLVPSINSLLGQLQDAVTALLPPGSDFNLGWVPYDNTDDEHALVSAISLKESLPSAAVTPSLSTTQFGPLQLQGSFSGSVAGSGTLTLGLGLAITDTGAVTPIVLTEPGLMLHDVNGNPFTPATNLSLSAGFSGSISGSVSLGALNLASGTVAVNLLANNNSGPEQEEQPSLTSVPNSNDMETFTLSAAPAMGTPLIVYDQDGNILTPDEITPTPNGSQKMFTITSNTLPNAVTVDYQTSLTISSSDVTNYPASFELQFKSGLEVDSNIIGAVPFTDLVADLGTPGDLTVPTNGIITGTVAVSALGGPQTQVIALGSSSSLNPNVTWIPDPQVGLAANALSNLTQNIPFDIGSIAQGINAFLAALESGLTSQIISKLPIVGSDLNLAGTFIGKLRTQFVVPFQNFIDNEKGSFTKVAGDIQQFIFNSLGPAGLNVLGPRSGTGTATVSDVIVTLDDQHFEIQFTLAGQDTLTADLSSGLAGLPLNAQGEGGVTVGMSYKVDFGIGVDRTGNIYLISDGTNTPEINLSLDAGLTVDRNTSPPTPTTLNVNVLGLNFSATDILGPAPDYNPGTALDASLTLEEMPTDGDHLPLNDILSQPLGQSFQVSLSASASLALHLDASLNPDLPNVSTDLKGSIGVNIQTMSDGSIEVDITPPTIGFYNITLDLGAFLTKYIGPVIAKVDQYIQPIAPLIDFLESDVPGISQLSEAVGNGPIKVLDLVQLLDPNDFDTASQFINIAYDIIQVAGAIGTNYGQLGINFGNFVLGNGDGVDVTQANWNDSNGPQATAVDAALEDGPNDTPLPIIGGSSLLQGFVSTLENMGITLNFLEPKTIFQYLIGQTADVITWNIPKLQVSFDWNTSFPIFPTPPIALTLGLEFDAYIQLSVGFDTYGVKTGHFLDGLYFGTAQPFAGFDLGVSLGAELDLGIASAGIQGEILGQVMASWNDSDKDGKFRLPEIAYLIDHNDADCIVTLSADVRAIVDLVYSVGIGPLSFSGSVELINTVLWSASTGGNCPDTQTAHVSSGGEALPASPQFPGGESSTSGELIVNAGPFASQRAAGATDVDESFTVTQMAPGVYKVDGMGLTDTYSGVDSIFFAGGVGTGGVRLVNVTVPATLMGGAANDTIYGGNGNNYIYGGTGNDTIYGGMAGGGTDSIYGGEGEDSIFGGTHTCTIYGGTGNDTIYAGSGNDDSVTGGSGDDLIYGYPTPPGGPGSGGYTDTLIGGTGNDCITAGNGGDLIYGGTGNDLILGGTGRPGNGDTLLGGWGNDIIMADQSSVAPNWIEGGPGDDYICGTNAADTILGGTGDIGLPFVLGDQADSVPPSNDGYHDTMPGCMSNAVMYTAPTPGTISGQVYNVDTGNGLDSWTVNLVDAMGQVAATQTTGDQDLNNNGTIEPQTESGLYTFTNVHPGIYTVEVILQPGYVQETTNQQVTVADGQNAEDAAIGVHLDGATIEGRKFNDTPGNGQDLATDPGINGWQIELLNSSGNVVATQFTSGTANGVDAGNYAFTNLAPGTYTVEEAARTGWVQSYPALPTLQAPMPLTVTSMGNTNQLVVNYTLNDPAPHVGDTVTFTVSVTNPAGDLGVSGVGVNSLFLPAGANYASNSSTQGTYDYLTGSWNVGDLGSGDTVTLQIQATATAASISLVPPPMKTPVLPVPADNGSAQARSQIKVSGMSGTVQNLQVTVNLASAPDDEIAARLESPQGTQIPLFTNVGGSGANFTGTVLTDASAGSIDGYQLTVIPLHEANQLLVNTTVDNPTAPLGASINFTATVTNLATNPLTVTPPVNDSLMVLSNTYATNGTPTITYTVTLQNTGVSPLSSVPVACALPAGVSFDSAAGAGSYDQFTDVWTLPSVLAPNSTATLTLTATQKALPNEPVRVLLPAGVSFVSATPSQGSYDVQSGVWTISGAFNGAQTATLQITGVVGYQLAISTPTGLSLANNQSDYVPNGNDTIHLTAAVNVLGTKPLGIALISPPPNASIAVTTNQVSYMPLGSIKYTAMIQNGSVALTNANGISVLLPAGVIFYNVTTSQGTYNPSTETWSPGSLAANGTATITINATRLDMSVGMVLPPGVTYGGQQGDGSYDPITGVWTVPGNLPVGGTASIELTATLTSFSVPAVAPFSGSYRPEQPLSTFNGQSPDGQWTLIVVDEATGAPALLQNWSLAVSTNLSTFQVFQNALPDPTDPAPLDSWQVTVAPGQTVTGVDFGNFQPTTVEGRKFVDIPGNGNVNPVLGTPAQDSVTVQLWAGSVLVATQATQDVNVNGALQSGSYSFADLPPGNYTVMEVVPPGWIQTSDPISTTTTLVGPGSPSFIGTPVTFTATISPTPPAGGWVTFDSGATALGTAPVVSGVAALAIPFTDAGTYNNITAQFSGVGSYAMSTSSPAISQTVLPVANYQLVPQLNFDMNAVPAFNSNPESPTQASYVGVLPSDMYNNVRGYGWMSSVTAFDNGPTPPSSDLEEDGAYSTFTSTFQIDLPQGFYQVTLVIGNSTGTVTNMSVSSNGGPGVSGISTSYGMFINPSFNVVVGASGHLQLYFTAGAYNEPWILNGMTIEPTPPPVPIVPTTGTVSGVKFFDVNDDGHYDIGDPGVPNVTIYADIGNLGYWVNTDPTAVTGADGSYSLTLTAGTHTIREIVPPGWTQTYPSSGFWTVTVAVSGNSPGLNFGDYEEDQTAQLKGLVFNDQNDNGQYDAGDTVMSGITVYADLNHDGRLDPGDPRTMTNNNGDYTLNLYAPGPDQPPTPYVIREVVPAGWVETAPVGQFYNESLLPAETLNGIDFGNFDPPNYPPPSATIEGLKFNDVNDSGRYINGDPGVAGVTIYADLNHDGTFDPGDPYTTTNAAGQFTLVVPAGATPITYIIREVVPAAWQETTPVSGYIPVTVTAGQPPYTGLDFGNYQKPITLSDGSDMIYPGNGSVVTVYGDNHFVKYGNVLTSGIDDNDTIYPGTGSESLDGQDDNNYVVRTSATNQTLTDTVLAVTGQGSDTMNIPDQGIDNAILTSSGSGATLDASAFNTPAGNITLVSGTGSDTLKGSSVNNVYQFTPTNNTSVTTLVPVSPLGPIENNTLDFSAISVPLTLDMSSNSNIGSYGVRTIQTADWSLIQTVLGGTGNDTITGNSGAENFIRGGPANNLLIAGTGNDTLQAIGGNSTLVGGSGPDTFQFENHWGTAVVQAGTVTGVLEFSAVTANLQVMIGASGTVTVSDGLGDTVTVTASDYIATILGGSGNDTFVFANGGELHSHGGTIDGGPGTNTLDYSLYTTAVNVNLTAGTATGLASVANIQRVLSGTGSNTLTAGTGNDTFQVNGGSSTINGGSGTSTFVFENSWGSATVNAGSGPDILDFSAVSGALQLTLGSSGISGTAAGNSVTSPNLAYESILGAQGNDTFSFLNDVQLDLGAGTIQGGPASINTVIQTTNNNQTLTDNSLLDGALTTAALADIEQAMLIGGTVGDTLDASAFNLGPVTLMGGNGSDCLLGGAGNDVLEGGSNTGQNNTLIGGDGNDTYIENPHSGVDILEENGGTVTNGEDVQSGSNTINLSSWGPANPFTIDLRQEVALQASGLTIKLENTLGGDGHVNFTNVIGGSGNETFFAGSGNDAITARDGADSITVGAGNDTISLGNGNDTITASNGSDSVVVDNGNDVINLGSGNQTVVAGNGNDFINQVGPGNDSITAGSGMDTINTGTGRDTIVATGNDLVNGTPYPSGINTVMGSPSSQSTPPAQPSPPVLTTAYDPMSGNTIIAGTFSGTPGTTYTLSFYTDPGLGSLGSGSVTTDSLGNATFNIQVSAVAAVGQSVTATATDPFGKTSGYSADVVVQPYTNLIDLSVTKSASPVNPAIGGSVTYLVTVTNPPSGPETATGVEVTDVLPAGLSFQSSNQASYDPTTGIWTVGDLPVNSSAILKIIAKVDGPPPTLDITPGGSATQLSSASTLTVSETVDNPTPLTGQTVHFMATLTNTGSSTASQLVVGSLLPTGVGFSNITGAPSAGGSYDVASDIWTVSSLLAGGTATLEITATAASNVITPITNTAFVTPVPTTADLTLSNSVDNPTPSAGSTIHFTATVTAGATPATRVEVTGLLPAGLTMVSASPTQGNYDATTGTWIVGDLPVHGSETITLTATVNGMTITPTVNVTPAPLVVTNAVDNPAPKPGDTIHFTATVANKNPVGAPSISGISVMNLLPAGLTLTGVSGAATQGTFNSGPGTWTGISLAGGQMATLQITATVGSLPAYHINDTTEVSPVDLLATNSESDITHPADGNSPQVGDLISFSASVTEPPGNGDSGITVTGLLPAGWTLLNVNGTPNPEGSFDDATGVWTVGSLAGGGTASLTITATVAAVPVYQITNIATLSLVQTTASLVVTNTVDYGTLNMGDTVNFTTSVSDPPGSQALSGVQVTGLVPGVVTAVSATPGQGSYDPSSQTWTTDLASGTTATLRLATTLNSPYSSPITPVAVVTSPLPSANLVVTSILGGSNPTANPNPFQTVTYVVTVTDPAGDSPTGSFTVSGLTLPSGPNGLSFVSASATPNQGTYNQVMGTWSGISLAGGETITLTIVGMAGSNPPTNLSVLPAVVTVMPQSNLVVHNAVTYSSLAANAPITFTVTVTNPAGASQALGVVVSDPLDFSVVNSTPTLIQAPTEGSYDPATGLWTVGDLAGGASATLVLSTTLKNPVSYALTPIPTPNPSQSAASLVVTNSVDNDNPEPGTFIHFQASVANPAGANTVFGVLLSDLLPTGVTVVSSAASQGTYNPNSGIWTVGSLIGGASAATLAITAYVNTAPTGTITNTAKITAAGQPDPNLANNTATATVTLPPLALPAMISGFVLGPSGLAGWVIDVYNAAFGNKVASTASLASPAGYYSFQLPAGVYTVSEEVQPGWVQTSPTLPSWYTVVLSPAEIFPAPLNFINTMVVSNPNNQDFSDYQPGSTTVVVTASGNGEMVPLSGWTAVLESSAAGTTGAPITGTTSAQGTFTFSDILPGSYTLDVIPKQGYQQLLPTAGGYSFTATSGMDSTYSFVFYHEASITTTSLTNWTVGQAGYNDTITGAGGAGSLTFSVTSGMLPPGLAMSPGGVLSGTPTAAGNYSFTASVTDATGASSSQGFTLTINPPITITTTTLANWTVNQPGYNQVISASGGTGTTLFSSTGNLPPGLALSTAGVLSGTPTMAGTYNFTVTATASLIASGPYSTLDDPDARQGSTAARPETTIAHGISVNTVVGQYQDATGISHAFLYNGSTWTTLNDPDGLPGTTIAYGISGSTVVGEYEDTTGIAHGFIYNGSTWTTLDEPDGLPGTTVAYGISGNTIVGDFEATDGATEGFLFNGSTWTLLDFPDGTRGTTIVHGVSGNTVVGQYMDAAGIEYGFVYDGSTWTTLDDPDALPGTTVAFGISGSTVVGEYEDSNGIAHSFVYNGSTYATLDFPFAKPESTMPSGVSGNSIAGNYTDATGIPHGFVYNGSTWATLDDPGAEPGTTEIMGISGNASGNSIVGNYTDSTGLPHGFIYNGSTWTTQDDPSAEPGTTEITGISGNTIVGDYTDSTGLHHGFVYNGSTWAALDDPGAQPGTIEIMGISGNTIVGEFTDSTGLHHGFVYNGSSWAIVDNPNAEPGTSKITGISGNNLVGEYDDATGIFHGFMYNGSTWLTLNDPDAVPGTTVVTGISGNNIIGTYQDTSRVTHGFETPFASLVTTNSQAYSVTVNSPLMITTTLLLDWAVNQPNYAQIISTSGGTGPLTFNTAGTKPPPGLNLSASGLLFGTPSEVGSYTFTIAVKDASGAMASQSYTVVIIKAATTLIVSAPTTATAGTAFNLTVSATDGAGDIAGNVNATVQLSTTLVGGISPTSIMLMNGTVTVPVTLTIAGAQTITANLPPLQPATAAITVTPGTFNQYAVTAFAGGAALSAGNSFLVEVQATDSYGNAVSSYGGPSTVTVSAAGSSTVNSSFPTTVSLNSAGFGLTLGTLTQVGTYTLSAAAGPFGTATPATVTVVPGLASKLGFITQPAGSPTGVKLGSVTVAIEDPFGNKITSDNTDSVIISVASGPETFLASSTLSATVANGVATFSNLTLVVPGSYTLGALVPGRYVGPDSNPFTVAPLQVVPGSFISSVTGFSVTLNTPFLVNSTTPVLYGQGFGATALAPTVTLTRAAGPAGGGASIVGSVVLNTAANSITFVATDTALQTNSGSPILPDGTYVAVIHGTVAGDGLQALNSGGGFLDGTNSGTPGNDFTATFTVNAAASHDDVLWVPATADGPLQALNAPGNNQQTLFKGGYPVYLNDSTGAVTSVSFTFNYNPALLTVTGVTSNPKLQGSTLTLLAASIPGLAQLQYTGPASSAPLLKGDVVPLGFLMATVPNSSTANPIYKAKELLTLSSVQINNSPAFPVVDAGAIHLVAFVGDADGNGAYSSEDAELITRALIQTDTGFTAYPLVDPVIVADTDGRGFIPADAGLQANEAGVGLATANLGIPPIPAGANTTPISNNVDPTLSIPSGLQASADGTVTVPINVDDAHPAGSTGLIRGHIALTYNPRLFTVSAADVHAGSLLVAADSEWWTIVPTIDQTTGQIAIALSSDTPITSTLAGSLVTIDFHPTTGVGSSSTPATFQVVAAASPNGQYVATELEDAQGTFTLSPAPSNGFNAAIDTSITLPTAASGGVLSGVETAPFLVAAAPPGDGHDDEASSPATPPFDAAVSAARDVSETAGIDVRQPVVVHGNDATHPLAVGTFAFSAAAALASSGSPLNGILPSLQPGGSLLGLSVASSGQRLVNAYLQAMAGGGINNPGDLAPFTWSLTDTFSRVFAGDFPVATDAAGHNNSLESSIWEELTGDLDWQQAVAAAATSIDSLSAPMPQVSAAIRQQKAIAWTECFAAMVAAMEHQFAEDD